MNIKLPLRMFVGFLTSSIATLAFGATPHSTRGYVKKDGTVVQPHRQTNPNKSKADNWSSKGNVNPDTGKAGTVDPYAPRPPKQSKK